MEIIVRHNGVYVKNVNLGEGFSDALADLTLDSHCRVRVQIGSKMTIYTDLGTIPYEVLSSMSEKLENQADNRTLTKIEKRIKITLDGRTAQEVPSPR